MDNENEDIKIKVYLARKKSKLLATAAVSIRTASYGFVTYKYFQIWESPHLNNRLMKRANITPPSIMRYGKYIAVVFFEDDKAWSMLEQRIYLAYLDEVNKVFVRSMETIETKEKIETEMKENNDKSDDEDIPF